MANARVKVPGAAKRGEIVEIFCLAMHPHESGFRPDNIGRPVPRNIVETFTCTYAEREVFRARLHPGIATNPYFAFPLVATETGELVFTWVDDRGMIIVEKAILNVS